MLNFLYNLIDRKENSKVIDIGVRTGMLTNQLYKDGAVIYGIDFSYKMLQIAQEKMPKAVFIEWDFTNGIPKELKSKKFDYIISSNLVRSLGFEKEGLLRECPYNVHANNFEYRVIYYLLNSNKG